MTYLIVNCKAYSAGTGESAASVARAARDVADETGARIAVAPQPADVHRVAETGVETLAQHVDGVEPGSETGSVLAEAVRDAGASGTLLNHSERRLRLADIDAGLAAAERADLTTVVCANDADQSGAVAALGPDFVAVEPPELIGSGTPVSKADPDLVADAADRVATASDAALLCGAGITSGDDVAAAHDLGAEGVLVASGVVKADDPAASMRDLVTAV